MKKFLLFLLLVFSPIFAYSQIKLSAYFDGYWGKWETCSYSDKIQGGYRGFIIYSNSDGPWNYYFKFTINNFYVPNKKQRKKDIDANKWYEFKGTVEYYVCDDYLTIYDCFKKGKGPKFIPKELKNGRPTKKIVSNATIKISAFKNRPECYNIWFDNVGLGISLNDIKFNEEFD